MAEDSKKHISKVTLVIVCFILLAFFSYWVYKFGVFSPEKGTSTASASAIWGQFIVSFLAVLVVGVILVILDIRKKVTPFYKLFSFWLIIAIVVSSASFLFYKKISYGTTHTYKPDEEFSYLEYKFKLNTELKDVLVEDCSGYSRLMVGWCQQQNETRKNKKNMIIHLTVKNTFNTNKHFTPDWFEVVGSRGTIYESDKTTIPNEISPNTELQGDLSGYDLLNEGETVSYVRIKIDNHAEQIVQMQK